MKKLKAVRVWAIVDKRARSLAGSNLVDVCWSHLDVREALDAWGPDTCAVACMLVPIEPKRKARRK